MYSIHMCAYTYTLTYAYRRIYIVHAYIHTCIHTCIHAYIHTHTDKTGVSDPFVKITIGKETQKSSILTETINPEWNETFDFLGLSHKDDSIAFVLYDHGMSYTHTSYAHTHAHTRVCTYSYACACFFACGMRIQTHIRMLCIFTYTMYALRTHARTHTPALSHTPSHTHALTYTQTHTHTRTHTHTHAHTHRPRK